MRKAHRAASVIAAFCGSIFLLFLVAPIARLIGAGGVDGVPPSDTDVELRNALALTALTATSATALAILGGTPLAYLLERRQFRGRALVAALIDLPLLIPHPVAGIALLLVLGRQTLVGGTLLDLGIRVVGSPLGHRVRDAVRLGAVVRERDARGVRARGHALRGGGALARRSRVARVQAGDAAAVVRAGSSRRGWWCGRAR